MKKNKRKQIERERLSLSLTVQRQVFFDMGFALLPTNHNLLVAHLHDSTYPYVIMLIPKATN